MINAQQKKNISITIKISLLVFTLLYIYYKLFYNQSSKGFWEELKVNIADAGFGMTAVIFLLMFVNWFIEAVKWRYLIRKEEDISLSISLKSVLAGVSMSIFTPNRVGEFAGKIFYLSHGNRGKAVFINVLGSLSQLLITLLVGGYAIFHLLLDKNSFIYGLAGKYAIYTGLMACAILTGSMFLVYFMMPRFSKRKFITLSHIVKDGLHALRDFSFVQLLAVLLLSLLRYGIFTFQYYLLLLIFKVELTGADAFLLIASTFFLVSVIPTYALTEIGVRGSVAIFLFGMYSTNDTGIIFSSLALWFVNLAIPALVGCAFIFNLNFFKR
jgi:hypothetical protein